MRKAAKKGAPFDRVNEIDDDAHGDGDDDYNDDDDNDDDDTLSVDDGDSFTVPMLILP